MDPIYQEWKSEWDQMMERFEDQCDNVMYLMRNMEGEEIRQEKWLDPDKVEEKQAKVIVSILGLDYLQYESEVSQIIMIDIHFGHSENESH